MRERKECGNEPAGLIRDLERVARRLRRGQQVVKVSPVAGRYRRRTRGMFHATPELFIQTGGATDFECPGGDFRLESGGICVMPSGVPHAETPHDLRSPYGVLVCMHARDGFWMHRGRADATRHIEGYGSHAVESVRGREALRWLDTLGEEDVADVALEQHVVGAVVAVLVCELQKSGIPKPSAATPLVLEAEKLVRIHLADQALGVGFIAKVLGCSPDHLARMFRSERGLGLVEWIVMERLHLAREFLREPHYQVAEAAWACGFSTPSYFIQVFRRHTGMTPRAWRMSLASASLH